MTTWAELRTVALVGTERRQLPTAKSDVLPALPDELGPEVRVMYTAALLGIARRAGSAIDHTEPAEPRPETPPPETTAPPAAVQLLELMLSGNAGPGTVTETLFDQWFALCDANQYVLPHRLLVAVLDRGAASREFRPLVQRSLGHRGRWLAAQRSSWSWAAVVETAAGDGDQTTNPSTADTPFDLDAVLELHADQRDAAFQRAREHDADAGRLLIADACSRLDAASRARVLACLAVGLSVADEELLEHALDDRSKAVRAQTIKLLNALPDSQRASRLARQLGPLLSKSGRLRTTFTVNYPAAPEDEQLRDVSPDGVGVIEQQWFDTLIVGSPLSWWETALERTPAKIMSTKIEPDAELLGAWTAAALAQGNAEWAQALFDKTKAAELLPLVSDDAAAGAFLSSIGTDIGDRKQHELLNAVPGPWSPDFSRHVVEWAHSSPKPKHQKPGHAKPSHQRLNHASAAIARHLSPGAQPQLEHWLDQARGDENKHVERTLRNLIQQLSLRTSITKAFS